METGAASLALDLALAAVLAAVAVIDLRERRIPDALSLPLLAAGLLWAAVEGDRPWSGHALGAAGGFGVLAAFGAAYFRVRGREGLGLGDAKLFGAAGAWLGWSALPVVLLIAAVTGLIFGVLIRSVRSDSQLAFGPWLATGFLATWLWL